MSELKKNQIIPLTIIDMNNLGYGVGRHGGAVIFVKGAVTGDVIECKIIKETKTYLVGRCEKLCEPSQRRSEKDFCVAPIGCGGCVYRSIGYDYELELKRESVVNAFHRAGLHDVVINPTQSTGRLAGYRNKAQYPVGKDKNGRTCAGFYASGTHRIVGGSDCALQPKIFGEIVDEVCRFADEKSIEPYDEISGKGVLRHIYIREGEMTGEILVCLVVNAEKLKEGNALADRLTEKFPNIVGVSLNVNKKNTNVVLGDKYITLKGRNYIEDILCGLRFKIAPAAFYQVNREGAELLYRLAAEKADLRGGETLLDLYCGTGTIGLSMAHKVKKLCGIEIVEDAVKCARENAAANGISNAEFLCADAGNKENILAAAGGVRPDVVIIDPPRKGSTKELVDTLAALEVPRVVYVSCDPSTLARDCAWFRERGYEIGDVTPVDMFPRTGHVESVVCLERRI